MSCQDLAATIDRFADSFARSIGSQSLGDYFRDLLPGCGPDFSVDAAVGEDLHPMLDERNENQYPGMTSSVMETVLSKRSEPQSVDRRINAAFRGDEPLNGGY